MLYVIDRREGDIFILEDHYCGKLEVHADNMPAAAREGDVIRVSHDGSYIIDTEETARRKADIKARFKARFKRRET